MGLKLLGRYTQDVEGLQGYGLVMCQISVQMWESMLLLSEQCERGYNQQLVYPPIMGVIQQFQGYIQQN